MYVQSELVDNCDVKYALQTLFIAVEYSLDLPRESLQVAFLNYASQQNMTNVLTIFHQETLTLENFDSIPIVLSAIALFLTRTQDVGLVILASGASVIPQSSLDSRRFVLLLNRNNQFNPVILNQRKQPDKSVNRSELDHLLHQVSQSKNHITATYVLKQLRNFTVIS